MSEATPNIEETTDIKEKTNADKNVHDLLQTQAINSPANLQQIVDEAKNQQNDDNQATSTNNIECDDFSKKNNKTKLEQELDEPPLVLKSNESNLTKEDSENNSEAETNITKNETKENTAIIKEKHDKTNEKENDSDENNGVQLKEVENKDIETIKIDESLSGGETTSVVKEIISANENSVENVLSGEKEVQLNEETTETAKEAQPSIVILDPTKIADESKETEEVSESKCESEQNIPFVESKQESQEVPEIKQQQQDVEEKVAKEKTVVPEKETGSKIGKVVEKSTANLENLASLQEKKFDEKQSESPEYLETNLVSTTEEKEILVEHFKKNQDLKENKIFEDAETETDTTVAMTTTGTDSKISEDPEQLDSEISTLKENGPELNLKETETVKEASIDKSEKLTDNKPAHEKPLKESITEEIEEAVEELMQTAKENKVESKISEEKPLTTNVADKMNKRSSAIDEITAIIEIDDDNEEVEDAKSENSTKGNEKEKATDEKLTEAKVLDAKTTVEKEMDENTTPEKTVDVETVAENPNDDKNKIEKTIDDKTTDEKSSDEKVAGETHTIDKCSEENKVTTNVDAANEETSTFDVIEIDDDDEESKSAEKLQAAEQPTKQDAAIENKTEESIDQISEAKGEEVTAIASIAKMHTMPIIFYKKECINFECPKTHKEFHRAPLFALNYFKISKKKTKVQYICGDCYDKTLEFYQDFCGILDAKQPVLMQYIANKKQEFVEILDSSDEDEDGTANVENKEKEFATFSQADLDLIESELDSTMRKVFDRVEIQNQLTWTKTIFTERAKKLQNELECIDEELNETQKIADRMYNDLYNSAKFRINTLKPLDLNNDIEQHTNQIPPLGEIDRPAIIVGGTYYGARNKAIACWLPCHVIEQIDSYLFVQQYRVKFLNAQFPAFKNLSAKLIAYYDPPDVRLSVGQRVIAYFDSSTLSCNDKEKNQVKSAFYPGIIAEEMKPNNFYRYLIFYDDGYTQYVSHKDVRLVCNVARNVWEDVDHVSRDFIKKYVQEYRVNRPMVQTHKGQKMATEKNGRWVPARVVDIDCSLVRMQFEGPKGNHTEWIYRGSLRLNPVYMEYQKSKSNQVSRAPVSRVPRRTEPFIRYTEDEEQLNAQQQQQQQQQQEDPSRTLNRSNSTSESPAPTVRHLNANTIYLEDENKPKGKVIYYTAKRQMPTRVYRPHDCGSHCLIKIPHNLNGYSPLAKPLLSGWERLFSRQKIKKTVYYRAPCGKMFRNMKELHSYLRLTKCPLNVDNFDFNAETSCLAEFEAENVLHRKRDISEGQEKIPLPLINYYDDTMPECTYSAKVIPTEGVNINKDLEFLICCDCEDDCVDKSKCACWQLTIEGVKTTNPDAQIDDIGYQYKRLYDHLPTGIYECNPRCKCKSNCLNRVVQHGLGMKLQVFKTSNRGWGLRCLNDIPQGTFICVYAGNLLTEAKANEGGQDASDEYFAELDFIETVEQLKEGYESDVDNPDEDNDEENYEPEAEDDADFRPSRSTERRVKRGTSGGARNDGERQAINFNPNVTIESETKKKRVSVRTLFGKDEAVYVMDAKVTGNLGRYFNHSCSPNLFVQNVFVDTHDLRFPWVAFFSLTHIRAGTELTWNYNYEVGVVPGKVLYCQCGAPNCRQRLL